MEAVTRDIPLRLLEGLDRARIHLMRGRRRASSVLALLLSLSVSSAMTLDVRSSSTHAGLVHSTAIPDAPPGPGSLAALGATRGRPTVQSSRGPDYGRLPLAFEANHGQTDARGEFVARGPGYNVFLAPTETVLALGPARSEQERMSAGVDARPHPGRSGIRIKLVGANATARPIALEPLPGRVNYFVGDDPRGWRTGIPTYARITYREVYRGIDVVYYGNGRRLEHDFVVAPGADPVAIRLAVEGAREIRVDASGDLVLETDAGAVRLERPAIYQDVDGARRSVVGRYIVAQSGGPVAQTRVAIEVAAYDRTKPLVIDPVLSYSTLLGGGGIDAANAIAVDAAGNAYVAGNTQSADFPQAGALQSVIGGGFGGTSNDAFVLKLDPTGSSVIYATFLGGSGADSINGIAIDGAGNAYVAGSTASTDFPTTASAFQTSKRAGTDAFVAKLSPSGAALLYSTYLGGDDPDTATAIAVDAAGNAYVTGSTGGQLLLVQPAARNFPTTTRAFQTTSGGNGCIFPIGLASLPADAFVTKLNATGSVLIYSSYLGGRASDVGTAIVVDSAGNAFVTGSTTSPDFPTTSGSLQPMAAGAIATLLCFGPADAFVAKVNAAGTALMYSTFLGGSSTDAGNGIAVDASGNAYVSGSTASTDFPVTAGAVQSSPGGGNDAFVAKLAPAGDRLLYATFVGGSGDDAGLAIAVDAAGNAFVTGGTTSTDFPLTPHSFQSAIRGIFFETGLPLPDAFMFGITADGSALLYSTFLGGSGTSPFGVGDVARGIGLDGAGNVYIAGSTNSVDFSATAGAFQTFFAGGRGLFGLGGDAFVAKFDLASTAQPPLAPRLVFAVKPSSRSVRVGAVAATFVTVINAGTQTVTGVRIAPSLALPARFDFHTTDPRTNATVGTQNTPVDIPGGASQSFVIAFTPTAPFAQADVGFRVTGTEATAVSMVPGVDTLLLSASTTGEPDLVVLSQTLSSDGIVTLGPTGGTSAFAMAIANVGTAATITVAGETDVFAVSGPGRFRVLPQICETNPSTGVCLAPPGDRLTFLSAANETRSFAVTVTANGVVPFDPAVNRVFVRFRDASNVIRGSTSIAVRTQ